MLLLSKQKLDRCFFVKSFFFWGGLDHPAMQDKCLFPFFPPEKFLACTWQVGLGKS